MTEIQLNSSQFTRRCEAIYKELKQPLMVILGKSVDVTEFNMNSALFHYLLSYEFPETILILKQEPVAIASPKKALILQQIAGLKIVIRNKDDSNLEEILESLRDNYGLTDVSNIKGELCQAVLNRVKYTEVTDKVIRLLAVKEQCEVENIQRCGQVANYLLSKGIELIRDASFSKEELEIYMNDSLPGINSSLIEYAFDPMWSANHIHLGIRYKGYCTEIARVFLTDASDYYSIQNYVLEHVRPGSGSFEVLSAVQKYVIDSGFDQTVALYTIGLLKHECDFMQDFEIKKGMVFCINISDEFCNTFIVNDKISFVTKIDSKEDYSEFRMRFRNKNNDINLITKIKEHQRDLLDKLIEEQVEYYKVNTDEIVEKKSVRSVVMYDKEASVPRSDRLYLDWDSMYVLVPLLSYSVPFHISMIKNVSVSCVNNEPRLRINFQASNNIIKNTESSWDTTIKSINIKLFNAEEHLSNINEMKKEFNKPKIQIVEQGKLKEKSKKFALIDLYMKTDFKGNAKKMLSNLEMHENGFLYSETIILFSNIKNIFYSSGDLENRATLHFNLKQPIIATKLTSNIQFFKKLNFTYHDTSKREDEQMEIINQREEEEEISRINSQFLSFIDKIESETQLKVQIPQKGFLAVHSKEAVHVSITNDCLVSITEHPFFILNLDEVEIVNFERVTFVTKTFDCVFIFKNKNKAPVALNSIETTKLAFIKELFDNHNIVFMETKVNINWNNLMTTIMKDPLSFYENGGWAELLREDDEEESDVSEESEDYESETSASSVGTTTSSDAESDSYNEDSDQTSSFAQSESDEESESERKPSKSKSEGKKSRK